MKRTFSLDRYLEFICTTDMFTNNLISFSKKPQNRKVRKYSTTSLQCKMMKRESSSSFCFIFGVKNSYNKVNFIQNNFTKLFLRESVSIDQFQ